MKKSIIMLLLSMVLAVGCQAQNDEMAPAEQASQEVESSELVETAGYEPGAWITDYQLALNYSEALNRPVLINFTGSDWCPWCFKLRDEVFIQPEFDSYAKDNLVLLTIDFPQKKKLPEAETRANEALAKQFGIEGFPTILLVNAEGAILAKTGYQRGGADAYVKHLQELLAGNESTD
ncbi:MAG: thioredoxin family protein [Candidatus Cloacimonetes bacterium]|nr:thioredoxin family protein [Candidatus Cloacimonadota bacterium]